jgi:hypothetical protein
VQVATQFIAQRSRERSRRANPSCRLRFESMVALCLAPETAADLEIEPAAVLGSKDDSNAGVLGKPATCVITCPSADVVGDDDNRPIPRSARWPPGATLDGGVVSRTAECLEGLQRSDGAAEALSPLAALKTI